MSELHLTVAEFATDKDNRHIEYRIQKAIDDDTWVVMRLIESDFSAHWSILHEELPTYEAAMLFLIGHTKATRTVS